MKSEDDSLCRTPLWVQITGIPNYWVSNEVGRNLGKLFHLCMNVIMPKNGSKDGRLLQLLAFHFYCGLIGHKKTTCNKKMIDSQCAQVCERHYKDWLRAKTLRRQGCWKLEKLNKER